MDQEMVQCTRCGKKESVPMGHLTAAGKDAFLCAQCRVEEQMPMESKVSNGKHGERRLLVEG